MRFRSIAVVFLCGLMTFNLQAQNSSDTLLPKDNRLVPLPTVSLNFGINHMMSDVTLSKPGPSPFMQFGYQLTVTQRVFKFLNVSLDLYTGSVYGEQMVNQTNLNFRTSLFSQRLSFEYNFYPLLKPDAGGRQLIRPYVGFGVGMVSFRSKGDLKDAHGVAYQYWSDGTINAEVEGTIAPSEATRLERDFVYETDLRDANLDGLGKYPQLAFTMPFNAGVRFQVSKNVGLNAAFSYCMNFSDMLDNVSTAGIGDRKGSKGNDNHLYGSIGLSFFLGNVRPTVKPKKVPKAVLASESKDKKKKETKEPLAENTSDVSGPKQKENEPSSSSNVSDANATGETAKNASMESAQTDVPSEGDPSSTIKTESQPIATEPGAESAEPPIAEEIPVEAANANDASQEKAHVDLSSIDLSGAQPKETSTFHWADRDGSGLISPDEVLYFIDLLFEGEGERSVEDIQNLIDYYFDQE
ncbi:MAG: hypothetical protein GC178_00375 [Flavobacteriales bacterium]|nr:hypothetical protein [Flavobacteriales bacterium]